ncbi:MAG: PQQ-binding-like beta-propeller repeat protein [Pirellulaceae bacterium]|nr:PQQ-binding-like beta-propeller repeat protein [Pirellulaceae bacterium]
MVSRWAGFRSSVLLVALSLLDATASLRAENWPQWRGLQHNGISTEKSIATNWSDTSNVLWKTPMPGQGGATPIVWNDRIFVTSAARSDLVLICCNTADGAILWQKKVTSGNQDARAGEGNSASPSPATDGQHVWVLFGTGMLACYDFDGNQKWQLDVNERFGKLDIQFGLTSTPVLDGDGLYLQLLHGPMVHNNNKRTGKVIKLDKLTGKTIWEHERLTEAVFECKHSYASPMLYDDGQQRMLIVHGADCTTGHALDDGRQLWRLGGLNGPSELNRRAFDVTFRFVATPAQAGGRLIIPTAKEGPTVALDLSGQPRGELTDLPQHIAWTVPQTPDVSIPLIVDGLVYLLHKDGKLQCIDLANGQQVYFERTHTVQHRTSPIYADGHIYFCGKDGVCTVVKAGRKFEIVASNPMGGQPITASPVVSSGRLYIRTYEALYAIAPK